MRTSRLFMHALAVSTGVWAAPWAAAQQVPATESGPAVVTVTQSGAQIMMRDAGTGAAIQMPRGPSLHVVRPGADTVIPQIEVRNQPSGYDVVYTFRNEKAFARPAGALNVGVLTLGQNIKTQNFRVEGKTVDIQATRPVPVQPWCYPGYLYSPVAVLRNGQYAVGVSLHYPILEYKHDVGLRITSPTGAASIGEGGRGWNVQFRLNNFGDEADYFGSVINDRFMNPGEQRTYVVSVRVTKTPNEWIRTLLPYRSYFEYLYGGVHYTRDSRPIRGVSVAGQWLATSSNPMGFAEPPVRPDVHGWGPWASRLKNMKATTERVMMWAPSGVFRVNRNLNYPFRFTSRWTEVPRMNDAMAQLKTVPEAGVELGLWWGRSSQVMRSWDTNRIEWLDPDNPEHVQIAFRELDLAVQAGATLIGLDYYFPGRETPLWKLYSWMQMMQQRAPGVKFITEARNCDVMHSIAPTLFDVYPTAEEVRAGEAPVRITEPFYLADFLLPGHETWGALAFDRVRDRRGTPMSATEQRAEMTRASAAGYSIVAFNMEQLASGYDAAESWNTTVPADIRASWGNGGLPTARSGQSGQQAPPVPPSGGSDAQQNPPAQGHPNLSPAGTQTGDAARKSRDAKKPAARKPLTPSGLRPD